MDDTPQLLRSALVIPLCLTRLPMEDEPRAHLREHYACHSQKTRLFTWVRDDGIRCFGIDML